MDEERIFPRVLRSSKRLSVFLDKDPAPFPSSERGEGGRESLPSVNVPTSLRLLCFVPTCAFQLSAVAAVSGSLLSKLCSPKCSVLCSQHKESTATEYRHQILDQVDRKCKNSWLWLIKKTPNVNNNTNNNDNNYYNDNNNNNISNRKRKREEKWSGNPHQFFASTPAKLLPNLLPERASQEQVETKPSWEGRIIHRLFKF